MLEQLMLETFTPHVGSTFTLQAADTTLQLELVAATALASDPADAGRRPFSLEFAGPVDPVHEQATVGLMHEVLGQLAIFIVPIASDARHTRYQAIFT